jgi:hypothetical protein
MVLFPFTRDEGAGEADGQLAGVEERVGHLVSPFLNPSLGSQHSLQGACQLEKVFVFQ